MNLKKTFYSIRNKADGTYFGGCAGRFTFDKEKRRVFGNIDVAKGIVTEVLGNHKLITTKVRYYNHLEKAGDYTPFVNKTLEIEEYTLRESGRVIPL